MSEKSSSANGRGAPVTLHQNQNQRQVSRNAHVSIRPLAAIALIEKAMTAISSFADRQILHAD